MKFRQIAIDWFLTYSQCPASADDLYKFIKTKFEHKLAYVCVSSEKHKDGNSHLHAQLQFLKKYDCTSQKIFDYVQHPNIQVTKDSAFVNSYVKKDGSFLEWGNFLPLKITKTTKEKKPKLSNQILLTGDLKYLIDTDQISAFSLASINNARKIYATMSEKVGEDLPAFLPHTWEECPPLPVHTGLGKDRVKKRNYWLYSEMVNKGKTTFLKNLASKYRTYKYNMSESFQDVQPGTQLVYWDEYAKGNSLKTTTMNELADGDFAFIRKGLNAIVLDNPILVVCSNYPIVHVYPNDADKIGARFNEICLDNFNEVKLGK